MPEKLTMMLVSIRSRFFGPVSTSGLKLDHSASEQRPPEFLSGIIETLV